MVKVSDYIIDFLAKQGIDKIFGVTGGAVVHLFDSAAKHPSIEPIFVHHEQTAAFAAQAYSKATNNIGAAFVTTGPGGTNAITGVTAAWLDSIPTIYMSGQTRLSHYPINKPLRQLGTQQLDIISIIKPITKWAVLVTNKNDIPNILKKAVTIAKEGRPGPVWIDIPMDIQWDEITPLEDIKNKEPNTLRFPLSNKQLQEFIVLIQQSKRPLMLIGAGVRLSKAEKFLFKFLKVLKIPIIASWNAADIIPNEDPLYLGRPGIFGQRGANLAMQNCDLLISIGSHLCISITGTQRSLFAREAKIIMVDIDSNELNHSDLNLTLRIQSDAKSCLDKLYHEVTTRSIFLDHVNWLQACKKYKNYNNYQYIINPSKSVNPYLFLDILSNKTLPNTSYVIDGGGTIVQIGFQALKIKKGQRIFIDAGLCAMGSGLPQSIGVALSDPSRQVICLCGDGSFQFNVQELQTIIHHNLNVKLFIFNNSGYLSIRHTQTGFLNDNFIGSASDNYLSFPDVLQVAQAYKLPIHKIACNATIENRLIDILSQPGPLVCEVTVDANQEIEPKQGFKKLKNGLFKPCPLENMYPFLAKKELEENMFVTKIKL